MFFFNDTATTEIYTLSLHDALPISSVGRWAFDYTALLAALAAVGSTPRAALVLLAFCAAQLLAQLPVTPGGDRKSTRLNSSHANISYAVFCLKTKPTLDEDLSLPER